MLGSPAAKRVHAPFLALPSIPSRGFNRQSRLSKPLNRNASIKPSSRPLRRGTSPPSQPSPPSPHQHAPTPMTGPYHQPVPVYRAPPYSEPWPNAVGGGWAMPEYFPPPPPYQTPYQPQEPPRPLHQSREPPSPAPTGQSGPHREGKLRRQRTPQRQGLGASAPSAEDLPHVYPSFTYQPPNFRKELRIAASPSKLYVQQVGSEEEAWSAHSMAIRDKCACSKCRDPSSSQKNFRTSEISPDLIMSHVSADEAGLRVTFSNDIPRLSEPDGTHVTILPWEVLSLQANWQLKKVPSHRGSRYDLLERTGVVHWDREIIANKARSIDYEDYVKGGEAMWDVVIDLARYGIVFLRNVPQDPDAIKRITTTIAPIKNTFYGETFDVRAKPNAENVAYTSDYLGLHQDLLYLESPPQIQILHCLENSCTGGESLFSDGDRIGRLLTLFPKSRAVANLLTQPVEYGYNANGFWYYRKISSTMYATSGVFRDLWWSPPFESPIGELKVSQHSIRGRKLLETLLNEPTSVYERKMEPGECVLFDNRRVMHGRNAFDAQGGGSRWLRGAYISKEDFLSKAAQLPEGYPEKTRDAPGNVGKLQRSLVNTHWHSRVKQLIQEDKEDYDAVLLRRQEEINFQQRVREREGQALGRNSSFR